MQCASSNVAATARMCSPNSRTRFKHRTWFGSNSNREACDHVRRPSARTRFARFASGVDPVHRSRALGRDVAVPEGLRDELARAEPRVAAAAPGVATIVHPADRHISVRATWSSRSERPETSRPTAIWRRCRSSTAPSSARQTGLRQFPRVRWINPLAQGADGSRARRKITLLWGRKSCAKWSRLA